MFTTQPAKADLVPGTEWHVGGFFPTIVTLGDQMLQSLAKMLTWDARTGDGTAALTDILFDPEARRMTYFALAPDGPHTQQILARASLLGALAPGDRAFELHATTDDLAQAPHWEGDHADLDPLLTAMPPLVIGPFGATHAPLALASSMFGEDHDKNATEPVDPRTEEVLDRYTRLTRWLGRPVFSRDAELGRMSDLLADPARNSIEYIVVENAGLFSRKRHALPFTSFAHRAPGAKGGHIVLDLTEVDYENAPSPEDLLDPGA
jgi:hypothetical protein